MTETLTGLTLNRLAPWLTPTSDPTGDHATYLSALASMGEQIFSLIWDQGDPDDADYQPGWGVLTDVDACPTMFLPWLAQLVGVTIPTGMSDSAARTMIRSEQGMQRGTPAALIATAQRFLAATKSVSLIERQGPNGADAYWFQIIVRPEELSLGAQWDDLTLPWNQESGTWVGTDQTVALTEAVNAVKPAGLNWQLISTDGHTWSSATKTWSAETIKWKQADTGSP